MQQHHNMNTINCRIQVNEYQDIPGIGITPAEAIVLRQIHDPSAANFSKTASPEEAANFWKFLKNVKAGDVAMTQIGDDGEDEAKPVYRKRTNAEEVARLRSKYLMRAKSGAQGSHIMDDIFPGQNPQLPETFEEIGLKVEAPDSAPLRRGKPGKKGKADADGEGDNEPKE